MPLARAADHVVDIELFAGPGVERANTAVEVGPQPAQFLDMGQQFPADAFLLGFGKARHLFNGLFQRLHHIGNLAQ
jgi:hypothetical protein